MSDSAPASGEYTRKGLRIRHWTKMPEGLVALEVPGGLAHIIVPLSVADEVEYVPNPFALPLRP